jgi:hypothetical protein
MSPRTKLIVICNPNNPTGTRFEAGDLNRVAAIADRVRRLDRVRRNYRGADTVRPDALVADRVLDW